MSAISTDRPNRAHVAVVGGGISGLATSYFLAQRGIRPILIEKSGRLGGLIKTDHIDGCDLEAGPDSFLAAKTSVAALAAELGISKQIIGSNDSARRIFIHHQRRLVPLPRGMSMMVPGDLPAALSSRLFSLQTKLHFVAELFRRPQFRPADVSIREFVTDHFGPDILNSVVEPLLSGVYGGDAASLSAVSVLPRFVEYERVYGSLIKGVRQEQSRQSERPSSLFLSFEGGMQTLVDALGESLQQTTDIRFAQVETVHQSREGWRLAVADGCIEAANVILACPAHVSARLLSTAAPVLANHLACISYSSAILITLVYERGSVHHPLDGFGFLVPQTERKSVAATTWISTKFPSRTPGHRCALRCFIVGRHATDLMDCSDAKLIETARNELEEKMGLAAIPLFTTVYRWPDSMPQYTVGHQERTSQILAELKRLNGLHLCGNAYDGVGIPDCIRLARQTANGIAAM